nr:helicase PriA [Leptospira sp. GIMC2001]
MIQYADIVVDLPMDNELLTYEVPNSNKIAQRGMRVEIEVKSRKLTGIIHSIHSNEPNFKCKPLIKIVDTNPVINEEQWDLAEWMKNSYMAGLGESLFRMIPQGRRLIREEELDVEIDAEYKSLNEEQQVAFDAIAKGIGKEYSSHLLYGITGSGKTEIYIHLIRELLEKTDRTVIFLVPEISLTFHIIKKLETIFPKDIALIHSGLKTSQRFRSYQSLLKGERRIAVGTRSAVFAPVSKPGLIILDEEHDQSYKENTSPRYHARQVAHYRVSKNNGILLLGSATPSVETFYLAKSKKIHFHTMKNRAVNASVLPEVRIVPKKDMEGPVGFELMKQLKSQIQKK